MVYLLGATTNGKVRHKVRHMTRAMGGPALLGAYSTNSITLITTLHRGRAGVHGVRLHVPVLLYISVPPFSVAGGALWASPYSRGADILFTATFFFFWLLEGLGLHIHRAGVRGRGG